jgi:hypothetical protein
MTPQQVLDKIKEFLVNGSENDAIELLKKYHNTK